MEGTQTERKAREIMNGKSKEKDSASVCECDTANLPFGTDGDREYCWPNLNCSLN